MRTFATALLATAAALALPAAGRADGPLKIQGPSSDKPAVGFPGERSGKYKAGCWAPVYAVLRNDAPDPVPAGCTLVVEAPDAEDAPGQYGTRGLQEIPAGGTLPVWTYARIGSLSGTVVFTLKGPDKKELARAEADISSYPATAAATPLYLTLGATLPDLERALNPVDKEGNITHAVETAAVGSVADLPKDWFGYQSADVVILCTSRAEFVQELLQEAQGRKDALAEWVRRGGRLVISASAAGHAQDRAALLEKLGLLDCALLPGKSLAWDGLDPVTAWVAAPGKPLPFRAGRNESLETASLEVGTRPERRVDVLVSQAHPKEGARPLIVQGPSGLGRVLLTAFDLDAAPFTDWDGREAFFRRLHQAVGPRADAAGDPAKALTQYPGRYSTSDELGTLLQDGLETFDEVPVISFGWVALFIVLYILVVGPLDYWFLKKVVKRLELTWVTFPVVVLTVSVAAYFVAYLLKGKELRVNKVDVVEYVADVDADGGQASAAQAHGTTWFTLFSPQIKHYTLGVEPAGPGWAPEPAGRSNPYRVLLSPLGRPDPTSYGRAERQGSGGLLRRSYEYDPGGGLAGVPVQVWATKSFTASWQAPLPAGNKLFTASLRAPSVAGRDELTGRVENGLPVDLQDAVVFFRGRVYDLGRLPAGQPVDVNSTKAMAEQTWFSKPFDRPNFPAAAGGRPAAQGGAHLPPAHYMKSLLFHDWEPNRTYKNNTVRELDQSWRVQDSKRNALEAVLVARAAPLDGKTPAEGTGDKLSAEDVTRHGASPTRLWLDRLPSSGDPRPPVPGFLTQETYVRVYIPILK